MPDGSETSIPPADSAPHSEPAAALSGNSPTDLPTDTLTPSPAVPSTNAHTALSAARTAKPPSLWHLPAMRLLAVYTLFGFTGFFVTISALPAWIAQQGTSDSLAGFVTTTLLAATVSTQTMVPRMVARFGMTATLAIGLTALGAPSLLFLVDGGYWWVLMICALRGIGFGSMTVLGAMLTARIVPPRRRGEAIGIYGLAIAVPNLLAVPGGVALVSTQHFWVVALLGAAPLLGLPAVRALAKAAAAHSDTVAVSDAAPAHAPVPEPASAFGSGASVRNDRDSSPSTSTSTSTSTSKNNADQAARLARRAARNASLGPAFVLMVVTLASGGFMTYLPIIRPDGALATIALLMWGMFGALTRWRIGLMADKVGLRALLPGSSVLSIIGICVIAGGLIIGGSSDSGASWAMVLVGSAILGTGFGGTQNLTLVAAFARARQKETATVSSVWNVGFDTGTAIGSGMVGLMILVMTIPTALALTALLIVASMPLAIRAARPVTDQSSGS